MPARAHDDTVHFGGPAALALQIGGTRTPRSPARLSLRVPSVRARGLATAARAAQHSRSMRASGHAPTRAAGDMERSGSPATDAPADALAKAAAEAATDRTLVARVREGDSQAFSALVQRHMRAAFAIAYHVLQHREDAEDAVQQAFVTALLRLDLYDAARPFGPWFARVVLNHARTARRARRRTAQRSVDHLDRLEASPLASPHRAAEDAEVRERVRAAVAMLPDRQRLAVQLVDVEGYAPSEVAGMLDLSPVTVRWHLMAARRTLRRLLAPLAPLPPLPPLPPLTEAAPPPRQGRGR